MAKVRLVYGNDYFDKIQPLVDGEVEVDGVELVSVRYNAQELFYRTLKYDEFDLAELSFDSFLPARAHGKDLVGLPVFPSRRFFHTDILVRTDSSIKEPADLRGKRLGLPEYQMSRATWTRGVLQHDFGVAPEDITWYVERSEELSHGGVSGFRSPAGVTIERIPPETSIRQLLLEGQLDAAMGLGLATALDRSGQVSLRNNPQVRHLFDYRAESRRFFQKYGYVPPNHVVVLKGAVVREHPWVAMSLFKAFQAAKEVSYRKLDDLLASHYRSPDVSRNTAIFFLQECVDEQHRLFGRDPSPYGTRANRPMMEQCAEWLYEQGFLPTRLDLDTVFAEGTRET